AALTRRAAAEPLPGVVAAPIRFEPAAERLPMAAAPAAGVADLRPSGQPMALPGAERPAAPPVEPPAFEIPAHAGKIENRPQ
ncbi:MAG TPA: hypothetical protein VFG47_20925, partial [Geminicoccaceae bacterium]|nr:hypothetical protein [Geminicoccaceae bacterium]